MWPSRLISISGSASSRCGSAVAAAENASPCASADFSVCAAARATVCTVSVPWYGCGVELTKPHARAWYVPGARLCAITVSFVVPPSLEPTSLPAVSPGSALSAEFTVSTSSLNDSSPVGLLGVHAIWNVNTASNLS